MKPAHRHVLNGLVFGLGLVAVVIFKPHYTSFELLDIAWFGLLGIVTNLSHIPSSGSTFLSLSEATHLAATLVGGPLVGSVVAVVSVTVGVLVEQPNPPMNTWPRRISRLLGDYGMVVLMIMIASQVYSVLAGTCPISSLDGSNYLASVGFIITYLLVNRAILYLDLFVGGQPLKPILQTERQDITLEVLTLHFGLVIALVYRENEPGLLAIFGAFMFAISWLMRRHIEQLQRRMAQLSALNEIGRAISAMVDISHLMQAIYNESSKVIDTSNFYIALYSPERDEVSFILETQNGQLSTRSATRKGGNGLTEYVIRTRAPLLLTGDITASARAKGIEPAGRSSRCWVGVPMIVGDDVIGMIAAQSYDQPRAFTHEHIEILSTIAAQAAVAIQNARLLEAITQQERLRHELSIARAIQQSLLPTPPDIPGLFIASCCLPAKETGGDLFDFILIDEHHLGIAVGDVVGKGVPAALLMATARSVLRAYAQHQLDPAAVLADVNRVMYEDTRGQTFVSLCYLVLDKRSWTLTYASAGHLSPLLCGQHQEPLYLEAPGCFPIGIQPKLRCINIVHQMIPHQAMLLYTDGVIEAHNAQRGLFGFEALQNLVAYLPGEQLIETIRTGVTRFSGDLAQEDDLTLVVIQHNP